MARRRSIVLNSVIPTCTPKGILSVNEPAKFESLFQFVILRLYRNKVACTTTSTERLSVSRQPLRCELVPFEISIMQIVFVVKKGGW